MNKKTLAREVAASMPPHLQTLWEFMSHLALGDKASDMKYGMHDFLAALTATTELYIHLTQQKGFPPLTLQDMAERASDVGLASLFTVLEEAKTLATKRQRYIQLPPQVTAIKPCKYEEVYFFICFNGDDGMEVSVSDTPSGTRRYVGSVRGAIPVMDDKD